MLALQLTEWLSSPETKMLLAYLRRRQTEAVHQFLAGRPVDPLIQGKAAGHREIELLLGASPEEVAKNFAAALREQKAS